MQKHDLPELIYFVRELRDSLLDLLDELDDMPHVTERLRTLCDRLASASERGDVADAVKCVDEILQVVSQLKFLLSPGQENALRDAEKAWRKLRKRIRREHLDYLRLVSEL